MNRFIVNLLAAGFLTLGLSQVIPAHAQSGNTGVSQESDQTTVITGDGNTVVNDARQNNQRVRRGRGTNGDDATIQRVNQTSDVEGNNNTSINRARQNNQGVNESGRRRRTNININNGN